MSPVDSQAETGAPVAGPLAGLRVLELAENVAGPYCAKLLGDLGASVIKAERPGEGDPARRRGPFQGDVPHAERSGLFLYLNTSKRSITLDLESEVDRKTFRALARWADVLVEDRAPGALEALGLSYAALSEENPALIVTSITPFGQTGPNAAHRSFHLNLYHGAGHTSPFEAAALRETRAGSMAGGYLGEYDAGLTAALGTLAAVRGCRRRGTGEHVDVSMQEAMMCLERVTIARFANEPDPFSGGRGPGGLVRAKDGWFIASVLEPHQWRGLLAAMGNPAWSHADWCQDPSQRMEHQDEINQHVAQWAGERTRDEIYHAAQANGTPAGPVRNVAEVMAWKQARERGFFRTLDHPLAGELEYPTAPYSSTESGWVGFRAPLLGEHNKEVLTELDAGRLAQRTLEASGASESAAPGPLAGIRVLDFTWAWAGPQGSLLLGMLGAEIIKVESNARLDHSRVHTLTGGGMSGGIDASPVFNELNLGKRSVTLNLQKEGARALVRELAGHCDVVLQNMRPGVLDRLGLGYEDLRKVQPDIIMLSSSAVGATGPECSYAGYAPTFACLSGVVSISGHENEPPIALSGSVDLRVGTASAFAVMTALLHRDLTGRGQNIDLSSTEVMSAMIGDAFVGYGLTGRVPERHGNRDEHMAPHGCYRCRGEGEWVTIAVDSETAWNAFKDVLADESLERPEFQTCDSRLEHQDELDLVVGRFTAGRGAAEVTETLQRAGIAAAIVQNGIRLARDPHLLARGVYETIEHPRLGALKTVRPPWRLIGAATPGASPLIGQHNDYVLGELLGRTPEAIEALVADEIVH